jgi:hypothetical protein
MPSSLASLLHQSLDFAGLFPPASLPASEALRTFRQEQAASTAGMLARFVCPMIRLDEIASSATADKPLVVSALPRGGKNAGEFLANLETDLATIRRLAQTHDGALSIDTIEVRPPVDALEPAALRKLLAAIDALLVHKAGSVRQVFVELAPSPALAGQLTLLAEQSATATQTGRSTFGYKLRTGGSDASSVPSAAMAAAAIAAAAAQGLSMKCTGGLHRPLRPAAIAGGVPMHGFINLLVASTLAATAPTEASTLESVLEETAPTAFAFAGNTVSWSDRRITTAEIAAARKRFLVSFGSCYAEQPRTELLKLGWWPKSTPSKSALVASS